MLKPDLKPDDICTCGSRRPYRDCHMPIYAAPRGKAIDVAHAIYAREWAVNAGHYRGEGLYAALASELVDAGEVRRVLDIGCGLGEGLEALRASIQGPGVLIAGVDENPNCLAGAAERLGVPPDSVAGRRVISRLGIKRYDAVPDAKPIEITGDLVLVQADVLIVDHAFTRWLLQNGPFDAITLWFTGGHKARSETKIAEQIGARSDEDFRWAIEDRAMEIAMRHLRPGGLVQVVNRASGEVEPLRRELEADRRRALAAYPFMLESVRAYPYAEPQSNESIVMAGTGGSQVPGQQMALSTLMRGRVLSTESATSDLFAFVRRSPFNIAPERAEALATSVFGTGDWTINPRAGKADFWAVVDDKAVYLTWAGLASLWCVAHVAYAVAQMASMASRARALKGAAAVDLGRSWEEGNLGAYIDYAKALVGGDRPWPLGIEAPDAHAGAASHEGKINNLFLGALSWILLHEIGHVHLDHDHILPADQKVRQEAQADDFATGWILEEAGSGLDREFRVLMIVTALAWLFLFESVGGQAPTHPPAILRFRAACARFDLGERSAAYEQASYVLKALFDPAGPPSAQRQTPRGAFEEMAQRLEALFPPR